MKYLKSIILFLVLASCNVSNKADKEVVSENETFQTLKTIVDQYTQKILQRGNVNSFALAIYKDGNMYQNYYGEMVKDANNKPDDSSLYEIASITKTFTGSLVARAVLAGKLNLDDDIRMYFEGDYANLEFEGQPITVKHMLTHSMGLKNKLTKGFDAIRNKVTSGTYNYKTDSYNIDDLLKELKTVEVDKKPGTIYAYNSLGPELLAHILEKVNNKPFNKQMDDFFKELGMNDTYLQSSQKHQNRLVKGYKGEKEAPIDYDPVYGAAGGMISTLPDLAKYMQFLIDNKNEPWVKEACRALFVDKEDDEQIGYLWQSIGIAEEEGYYYSKTGTSNGTQSGILICPDSDYGIVLIGNNTSDKAFNDWGTLFFTEIEPDIIKYPRLNLISTLKTEFNKSSKDAFLEFQKRKNDSENYYLKPTSLNNFGYELLNEGEKQEAIDVFKFATEVFPENANAYDSLGEAYFVAEDYQNALINYKKTLELNPENETAKTYIKKIEDLNMIIHE